MIEVPDETTGYILGLEEEVARLRNHVARLEGRDTVREDYPLRCGDCSRAHILDCSLPSDIWNQIARPEEVLCPLCIDLRLQMYGIWGVEAEFYYAGAALASKLYAESHGDVAHLRARVAALEAEKARLVAVLEDCAKDLEDEITHRYVGTSNYPSMIARMNRDLEPVGRARAELDAVKGGGDA